MSPNTELSPAALAAPRFVTAGFAPHLVPYTAGLALQQRAVDRLHRGVDRGTVYLLEHPPVYTAGRRSDAADYPRDGTQVVTVDRGGKVTWHGPGQVVRVPRDPARRQLWRCRLCPCSRGRTHLGRSALRGGRLPGRRPIRRVDSARDWARRKARADRIAHECRDRDPRTRLELQQRSLPVHEFCPVRDHRC